MPPSIEIYLARIELPHSEDDNDLAMALQRSWLSDAERNRVRRFRFVKDQYLSLASKQLLRWALARAAQCPPESLVFASGEHGKPYLPHHPDIHFNLSHTDDTVVLAVSHSMQVDRIGVDVEKLDPKRGSYKLAKRFFSADETTQLLCCTPWETQGAECFNQLWTLKESFIKAMGTGLSMSLRKFSFDLRAASKIQFHADEDIDTGVNPWWFGTFRYDLHTGIALGYQAEAAQLPLKYFEVTNILNNDSSHSLSALLICKEIPLAKTAQS